MNCPNCNLPQTNHLWFFDCGSAATPLGNPQQSETCREIAALRKRVKELEQAMTTCVGIAHYRGWFIADTDGLFNMMRQATLPFHELFDIRMQNQLRMRQLDGGKILP